MSMRILNSKVAWGFFKADSKNAYKQLLIDQEYVNLTLETLRNPASGLWYDFAHRVLLFGAVS